MSDYDSTADTRAHIRRVQALVGQCIENLDGRAAEHDRSKLEPPEKEAYDEATPKLRATTYGSPEYFAAFEPMKPAIDHHYAHNSHHPEHYPDGIAGMSLFDVLEMLMDWKAASERHADGDIIASLDINRERFGIEPQLLAVLRNTMIEMGWGEMSETVPRDLFDRVVHLMAAQGDVLSSVHLNLGKKTIPIYYAMEEAEKAITEDDAKEIHAAIQRIKESQR